jgi:hypothetical protein
VIEARRGDEVLDAIGLDVDVDDRDVHGGSPRTNHQLDQRRPTS